MENRNSNNHFEKENFSLNYTKNKDILEVDASSFQPMIRLRTNAFYMFGFWVVTGLGSEEVIKWRKS